MAKEQTNLENRLNTLQQTVDESRKEIDRLTKEVSSLRRALTEKHEPDRKERAWKIYGQVTSTIAAVGALGALIAMLLNTVG